MFFIKVVLFINLDKLRDSPLPHFFAYIFTFRCLYLVLLTVMDESIRAVSVSHAMMPVVVECNEAAP